MAKVESMICARTLAGREDVLVNSSVCYLVLNIGSVTGSAGAGTAGASIRGGCYLFFAPWL